MAGGLVVSVAFDAADEGTLEPDPTWTDITAYDSLVASATVDRGRQYELDITDTGTASVAINDRDGILDPTNSGSPFAGDIDPLLQIKLELLNPVTAELTTIFRGYVEEWDYVFHPSQKVNQLTLSCVDALAILSAIEMHNDGTAHFGDPLPPDVVGIFFDNANVDDRIIQVLGNAGWPDALAVIFSGNVSVQETIYSDGDTVLQVIQDAADAEFPGVANFYTSKLGYVTFHGRQARFDPVGVAGANGTNWDFNVWKAGDGAAVAASIADTGQIRLFSLNRGVSKIINYASATAQGIADADVPGQLYQDPTSIGKYGYRSWSKQNLLTLAGLNDGLDTNDETFLFAEYLGVNYATPQNRITAIAFKSMRPTDPRAAANWALICGVEISDGMDVTVASPGGGGLDSEENFIEGVHYDIKPATGDYADVTLTLDLSPQAYYATNTFSGDG